MVPARFIAVMVVFGAVGCGKQVDNLRSGGSFSEAEYDGATLSGGVTPVDYRHVVLEMRNCRAPNVCDRPPIGANNCLKWTADITGSKAGKGFENVQFKKFEGNNIKGQDYGAADGNSIHFFVQTTVGRDVIEFDAARDDTLNIKGTVTDNCKGKKTGTWTVDTVNLTSSVAALGTASRQVDFVKQLGRMSWSASSAPGDNSLKPFAVALDDEITFDLSPKINIRWQDAGAASYDVAVGVAAFCEAPLRMLPGVSGLSARIDALPVGNYHVCVTARSADGLTAAASNSGLTLNVVHYPTGSTIASAATLGATGLYADIAHATLINGFRDYEPRYPLWSNGAAKKRSILLPPGAKIDTTDQNHWVFPVGTIAVKEFASGGRRLETRILVKTANAGGDLKETWAPRIFVWNDDQADAAADADGAVISSALPNGGAYDVPSESQCATCHAGSESYLIGFSGLQLAGASTASANAYDLNRFAASGFFSTSLTQVFEFKASTGDRAALDVKALGYLHGNCGHCHNASAGARAQGTGLYFRHDAPVATFELEPAFATAVGRNITPGSPSNSRLIRKMDSLQMPPLGVSVEDTEGVAVLSEWITKLSH